MKKHISMIIVFLCAFLEVSGQSNIKIKNLEFNTENSDFGTIFYKENQLIFSSAKKQNRRWIRRLWKPNSQPYLDLYAVALGKGDTQHKIVNLPKTINTKYHESSVAFSTDYKTMYFTRNSQADEYSKQVNTSSNGALYVYKATYSNGQWQNIKALPFNSPLYSTGHPTISKDGKKLYFISDMPGGFGDTDIYEVTILGNDTYSAPKNLGAKINTSGKEMFPYVDENNNLFFSSDGRADNKGGLDVYTVSLFLTEEVHHLPKPINSKADDFALIYNAKQKKGYFSSNRNGGKGDDDIYEFNGKINTPCYFKVKGYVVDKQSSQPISDATVTLYTAKREVLKTVALNTIAMFEERLRCKQNYIIKVTKDGYESVEQSLHSDMNHFPIAIQLLGEEGANYKNHKKTVIEKLHKPMLALSPILFTTKSYALQYDAMHKLDQLIRFMNQNPKTTVIINAHADYRGKKSDNMKLSTLRMLAALKYLEAKGISRNRIVGYSYGETKPVNYCKEGVKCSKEKLGLNRRIEFEIRNR